jgi:hypothetical protein
VNLAAPRPCPGGRPDRRSAGLGGVEARGAADGAGNGGGPRRGGRAGEVPAPADAPDARRERTVSIVCTAVLTDISLCHACSCQEILRVETARQDHPAQQFQLTPLRMIMLLAAPIACAQALGAISNDRAAEELLRRQRLRQHRDSCRRATARDASYRDQII